MAILREHLVEKVAVSEVCEKHGLQPAVFWGWQRKPFEEGAVVFEQPRARLGREEAADRLPGARLRNEDDAWPSRRAST